MFGFSKSEAALFVSIVVIICKAVFANIIYKNSTELDKWKRGILTRFSISFPIITGIVCIVKCNQGTKKKVKILLSLLLTLGISVTVTIVVSSAYIDNYYDAEGNAHFYQSDVFYLDKNGNKYTYDFDKSGYERLYINGSNSFLNADLCYLDQNGYLVYDEDMSITAKNEYSCVETDGSLYYPVNFAEIDKDGAIHYSFNSANFSYDRFKNAYTYDNIPYYDSDLNKYAYSFDSQLQKGFYTNISTGETYENEFCFVDESGFLVYDVGHAFTQQENNDGVKIYTDPNGKIYFLASGIHWDKNGNLVDSYGNILSSSGTAK